MARDVIVGHCLSFGMPVDAAQWLGAVWDFIQMADDCVDGDPVDPELADRVVWEFLVGLPSNAFYREHMDALTPVLALQILKWRVCNEREKAGKADAVTFVWRAGFYDVVLAVSQLCGMTETLVLVPDMYGETFENYLKEMQGGENA